MNLAWKILHLEYPRGKKKIPGTNHLTEQNGLFLKKNIGLYLSLTTVSGSSFTKTDLVYEEWVREGFDFPLHCGVN